MDVTANIAASAYMDAAGDNQWKAWRGRPRTSLPVALDKDLVASGSGYRLRNRNDLERLRALAANRGDFNALFG